MARRDRFLRWKSAAWIARPLGAYPNVVVEVGPMNTIEVFFSVAKGQPMEGFRINRKLAKLAAKRITQCLEETK